MTEFTVLPGELSAAVDRIARKRTPKKDPTSLLLARHAVLRELGPLLRPAEQEGVDQLRKAGVSWAEISKHDGRAQDAVWAAYGSEGSTTPETRQKRVKETQLRVIPDDMPGRSVREAALRTGVTPATVRSKVALNEGAAWYVQHPTPKGKRKSVLRIVDIDALKKLLSEPRPGPKTPQD